MNFGFKLQYLKGSVSYYFSICSSTIPMAAIMVGNPTVGKNSWHLLRGCPMQPHGHSLAMLLLSRDLP